MTFSTLCMSVMFLRILREGSADANIDSAELLQHAGYIRKAASSVWT